MGPSNAAIRIVASKDRVESFPPPDNPAPRTDYAASSAQAQSSLPSEKATGNPVVPAAGHSDILLETGSRAIAGQTCVDGWLCVPNA